MKFANISIYQSVQITFNKIYQLKEFECVKNSIHGQEIIDFWNYVIEESLFLMRQLKMLRKASEYIKCISYGKNKVSLSEVTYHDILRLEEIKDICADKKKYMNYALLKGYESFEVLEKEKNELAECQYTIFDIAEKMERLEYVLITQKEVCERWHLIQEVFC